MNFGFLQEPLQEVLQVPEARQGSLIGANAMGRSANYQAIRQQTKALLSELKEEVKLMSPEEYRSAML